MQGEVGANLDMLGDPDVVWQPSDFLPDLTREDWPERLAEFRAAAAGLSDELLIVLVGDMITEEALPAYSVSLGAISGEKTFATDTPWGKWLRGWTAEENRHGDLLNAYLRLTGRVDMRAIEVTIHHLLMNGFNPMAENDPYTGLIYTAFQERATKVSHRNAGLIARREGDAHLNRICQRIAGDESRHEMFYTKMMGHVLDVDPDEGMVSIQRLIRNLITMPGKLMYDGKDPDLFDHYAVVAQQTGVYTTHDYADILAHLVSVWHLAERSVSGAAAKAQHWLCKQAEVYHKIADRYQARIDAEPVVKFSWLGGCESGPGWVRGKGGEAVAAG